MWRQDFLDHVTANGQFDRQQSFPPEIRMSFLSTSVPPLRIVISAMEKITGSPLEKVLCSATPLDAFASYLAATAHIIRASTDLMKCAADLLYTHSISNRLHTYFLDHVQEEYEHYDWILKDLSRLDCDTSLMLSQTRTHEVTAVPGIGYYYIRNINPICVVGYIAVMESSPPTDEVISRLQSATGACEDSFRTLRAHGTLDLDHADELFTLLGSLELSNTEKLNINEMALRTLTSYSAAMASVLDG